MPYCGNRAAEIASKGDIPRTSRTRNGKDIDDDNLLLTDEWCDVEQHAIFKCVTTSPSDLQQTDSPKRC